MKGNVAAGLALLPRALPGAAAGGPLSPLPASGRWLLSPAHLPVCQRAALNSGELLGRTGSSASPNSKRKPHGGVRQPWERGRQRRRAPGAGWQKESPHPLSPQLLAEHLCLFSLGQPQGTGRGNRSRSCRKHPASVSGGGCEPVELPQEPVSGALERVHRFLPEVLSFRFPLLKRCQGLGSPLLLPSPPRRTCPQPLCSRSPSVRRMGAAGDLQACLGSPELFSRCP